MRRGVLILGTALTLGACDAAPPAPSATCIDPKFAPRAAPDSYAGRREQAEFCIKSAAYALARRGGPVAAIGPAAFARCVSAETAVIAALRRTEPVYAWERREIDQDLSHLAQVTAVRARSRGCGLPPGQTPDTMLQSDR